MSTCFRAVLPVQHSSGKECLMRRFCTLAGASWLVACASAFVAPQCSPRQPSPRTATPHAGDENTDTCTVCSDSTTDSTDICNRTQLEHSSEYGTESMRVFLLTTSAKRYLNYVVLFVKTPKLHLHISPVADFSRTRLLGVRMSQQRPTKRFKQDSNRRNFHNIKVEGGHTNHIVRCWRKPASCCHPLLLVNCAPRCVLYLP